MISRVRFFAAACVVAASCLAATPVSAGTSQGSITGWDASQSCFAGSDGQCSASATSSEGDFAGTAILESPDSPFSSRAARYAQALGMTYIGFDLEQATPQAQITVTLDIAEAAASWTQETPTIFGGTQSADSRARVLFQLLGRDAPDGCGCGFVSQGSPDVVAAMVDDPGETANVTDTTVNVTMTAVNRFGDGLLVPGHYEVMLRAYALNDLRGSGDWGSMAASVRGQVQDVSVTVPAEPTNLTLSFSDSGPTRLLTATLTGANATPLSGQTILFYADGELVGQDSTDQLGVADVVVGKSLRGGHHTFTAVFEGTDDHLPSTAEVSS